MPTILAYWWPLVKWVGIAYCLIMDSETLRSLARRNQRDRARERASYDALRTAIWQAHDEQVPQVDIVRATGLTRERIRQITGPKYRERHSPGA